MNLDPAPLTWVPGAAVLAALLLWGQWTGAGLGAEAPDPAPAPGRYRPQPAGDAELEALMAIGYLSGTQTASDDVSVTVHDPDRAWQGTNLTTSGHGAEAVLMDMDGATLHHWALPIEEVWPDWPAARVHTARFWRRVWPLDDGALLAIYEGVGLVKVDRDSRLIWKRPNRAHHDLEVLEDGTIVTLSRRARRLPALSDRPILEDFVIFLDPEGAELRRVSILDAYQTSGFEAQWEARVAHGGDVFHTNAVEVLDGSQVAVDPAFAAGNVLISLRNIDAIAVLDPAAQRIVWSHVGDWRKQHDPHLLPNGRLLLFDNGGRDAAASRVLELEPDRLDQPVWQHVGTPEAPFRTGCCGTAQRLPNGNTLLTESDAGRAFEVTRDGAVVWAFHSPHRPADDPTLVATLFENLRLPATFGEGWATGG